MRWRQLTMGVLVLGWTVIAVAEMALAPDGMAVIDGERRFLLGLYEGSTDPAFLEEVKAAGFHFVRANLDAAQLDLYASHGLDAWINLGGRFDLGPDGDQPATGLEEAVAACGAHPALLVWEMPDEALWCIWLSEWRSSKPFLDKLADFQTRAVAKAAGLQAGYETMKCLDAKRPVWMNHAPCNSQADLALYGQAADIVGCDIYPVVQFPLIPWDFSCKTLGMVGCMTDYMQSTAPGKPVWMVLQGFGYGDIGDVLPVSTRGSRRPTPSETRFMAYDAVVRGARALLYWGTHAAPKDSDCWRGVKEVVRELADLEPVLAAPDAALDFAVQTRALWILVLDKGVYALPKAVYGAVWWFVVNELPFSVQYTIRNIAPLEDGRYEELSSGKGLTVRRGRLSAPIEAFGVHVWQPVTK